VYDEKKESLDCYEEEKVDEVNKEEVVITVDERIDL